MIVIVTAFLVMCGLIRALCVVRLLRLVTRTLGPDLIMCLTVCLLVWRLLAMLMVVGLSLCCCGDRGLRLDGVGRRVGVL